MSAESKQPTTAPKIAEKHLEDLIKDALSAMQVQLPLALAVSGGGDSVALMHLVAVWARDKGFDTKTIFVLTVDHGLRPAAAAEAGQVAAWAGALGLSHETLHWEGDKPQSRIQEKARAARYDLMGEWCAAHQVENLLLAHTASDQTETVGMRFLKGSGTRGLAGMQATTELPQGVRLIRPLLAAGGDDLRTWLAKRELPWFEDPSNENQSYDRVRMRRMLEGDAPLAAQLDSLNDQASDARSAMEQATDDLLRDGAKLNSGLWAQVDRRIFRSAPPAIIAQALSRMILALGGGAYQAPQGALSQLTETIFAVDFKAATLGRCIIAADGPQNLLIGREGRNITSLALTAEQEDVWDNRIRVGTNRKVEICALGQWNMEKLSKQMRDEIKEVLPPLFRPAAMAVVFEDGQEAIPFAGIGDWTGLEASFGGFAPFGAQSLKASLSTGC